MLNCSETLAVYNLCFRINVILIRSSCCFVAKIKMITDLLAVNLSGLLKEINERKKNLSLFTVIPNLYDVIYLWNKLLFILKNLYVTLAIYQQLMVTICVRVAISSLWSSEAIWQLCAKNQTNVFIFLYNHHQRSYLTHVCIQKLKTFWSSDWLNVFSLHLFNPHFLLRRFHGELVLSESQVVFLRISNLRSGLQDCVHTVRDASSHSTVTFALTRMHLYLLADRLALKSTAQSSKNILQTLSWHNAVER